MTESTARVERVTLQSASSPAFTWEPPEKPISVRMPFALIDRMEREVVESFRSLTSRGSEIGGLLLGAAAPGNPTTVFIDDYELIPCDYSRGPLFRLSDADMGRFERALDQRLGGGGLKAVGFFRSHTRKGLSLDSEDLSLFGARFRDPSAVALLVRPSATKASTAGFFIWENGAVQGESSYLEFPFRTGQLSPSRPDADAANPAAAPPPASKPPVRAQIVPIASRREVPSLVPREPVPSTPAPPTPAPVAAQAPVPERDQAKEETAVRPAEHAEPPEKAAIPPAAFSENIAAFADSVLSAPESDAGPAAPPAGSRGKTARVAVLAVAALVIFTFLFLYPGVLRRHSARAPALDTTSLALRVEFTGPDILLTWNRDSAAIQQAAHVVLSISDGQRHENYDMDPGQLRNGSIVYSPLTSDVSFRMEVTGPNNVKSASESVRVLRTPRPSPMPDGSESGAGNAKTSPAPASPAEDPVSQEPEPTAGAKAAPAKPFDTESLTRRLRPATADEISLPEAPAVNNSEAVPSTLSNIGANPAAPAPYVAPTPAAPPAATERRSEFSPAQVIRNKQPEYPNIARNLGVKGAVQVLATIDANGRVIKVKVVKGSPVLVRAATDAVMQWVYKPARLNGVPIESDAAITLNFVGDK